MSDVIIAGATYPDVPAVDLNKSGGGIARYYEPSEILYAASPTSGGSAIYANGIHYAQVDATSTATVFTATIDGITEYYDGLTVILKNGIITSESGFTIDINNLGAKPCYSSMEAASRETTIFNINYTMMFVYDSSRVSGGCWVCYHGYNALSNATPAALGTASAGSSSETARADHVHEKPTYTATDVGALPDTTVIPTKTSDLVNDSNFMSGMTILSYGNSTWNDFLTAYTAKHVVYARASSNSNPATGSQTRMAFMAYVSNAENPTNVEFQYYRSMNTHSATQQGDQVYVYKLDKTAGWSVTVRENYTKIVAGSGLSSAYSSGTLTLTNAAAVPSGGTTGQVLTKTSSGYDWGNAGSGLPSGGTAGQLLQKNSSTEGDASWANVNVVPSGGTTGQVLTKDASGYGWATPSGGETPLYTFYFLPNLQGGLDYDKCNPTDGEDAFFWNSLEKYTHANLAIWDESGSQVQKIAWCAGKHMEYEEIDGESVPIGRAHFSNISYDSTNSVFVATDYEMVWNLEEGAFVELNVNTATLGGVPAAGVSF